MKGRSQRQHDGTYIGAYLSSQWYMQRNGILGSLDDVASFAPEGCVLTIYYHVPHPFLVQAAKRQYPRIRQWLNRRGIAVHFKALVQEKDTEASQCGQIDTTTPATTTT